MGRDQISQDRWEGEKGKLIPTESLEGSLRLNNIFYAPTDELHLSKVISPMTDNFKSAKGINANQPLKGGIVEGHRYRNFSPLESFGTREAM
jgi:hypothetical protein